MENSNSSDAFFDGIDQNMTFPFSPSFPSIFDMVPLLPSSSDDPKNPNFDFSDMLDVSDYLLDCPPNIDATSASNIPVNYEVLNTLVTLNSSNAATGNENEGRDGIDAGKGENQVQGKTNKDLSTLMPKKKYQKRSRGPRFAFLTKSEEDYLDDGYKWRKYGQKDLKKSPHPRSYFRCMAPGCEVKKHVERYLKDPSMVMTTYEGQHTHTCPTLSRDRPETSGSILASPLPVSLQLQQQEPAEPQPQPEPEPEPFQATWEQNVEYQVQAPTMLHNNATSSPPLNDVDYYLDTSSLSGFLQNNEEQPGFVHPVVPPQDDLWFNNSGLLQDIVPMHVRIGDKGNHM